MLQPPKVHTTFNIRNMRLTIRSLGVIALCGVTLCAGCAPDQAESSTSDAPQAFDLALSDARNDGVDPSQIAILERARDKGSLEIDDVQMALDNAFACMDSAGVGHSQKILKDPAGYEYISYTMTQAAGLSTEQSVQISDDCVKTYSTYVEQLYVQQPSIIEMQDTYHREVLRPAIAACFDKYGVAYDSDASWNEFWDNAFYVVKDSGGAQPGDASAAGCIVGVTVGTS